MVTPPLFCCACKLVRRRAHIHRSPGKSRVSRRKRPACLPASGSHAPNRWSSSKWPSLSLYLSLASAGYDDPFPARVNRTVPSSTRNF